MRQLSPKQHRVLPFIQAKTFVSVLDLANVLGLSPRTVRDICKTWVAEGFLQIADPSKKARMYKLGDGSPGVIQSIETLERIRPLL